MGRLSAEDLAALETLQATVRSNDSGADQDRLRTIGRMASATLRSAGIDPTPRPGAAADSDAAQAAKFHRALQDELSIFDGSKGREATAAEAYDIVKALKDTGIRSGWLKVNDSSASPTVLSDFPPADDAFHQPGVQIAQAGPEAPLRESRFGSTIGLAKDFETFHRQMEEQRQREAADQTAAGTGGAPGAPATEPFPGSPEYEAADAQARAIAAELEPEGTGGQGGPQTEPPPGSPEYQAAEAEARKLDENAWENLGLFGQLGIAFKRFDAESKRQGAVLGAESNARRLETVLEFQRRQGNGEVLNVTEKRYLLKNRNVTSDLAGAVVRLIDAQRRLDELPSSNALRRLSEASTVAEAGQLLRDHPGEIARAIGVESLPALTISLIAAAALGPIGSAIAFTARSGLEGYATGLVGALAREGVDVSDADELTRAVRNGALMERVRKDATTAGAIATGMNIIAMAVPVRIRLPPKRAPLSMVMRVPPANAKGRGFASFDQFKNEIGHAPEGYEWHHIVTQSTANINQFGAARIHNTNNLVLLPRGRGSLHRQISAHYGSKEPFADPLLVRDWLSKQTFEQQAAYGRNIIENFRRAMK